MGKRKLEVKKIEDKKKQRDIFEARQRGLFKKARQLVQLYDAGVALITISEVGKISEYGNPTLDSILQRYQEAKKGEAAIKASNDVQPQKLTMIFSHKQRIFPNMMLMKQRKALMMMIRTFLIKKYEITVKW
nr:MADS-box transcription factor 23-like [Coffea arabica]